MPTTGLPARKTTYMCKTILLLVDAAPADRQGLAHMRTSRPWI